jgi:hypothetical protein
MVPLIFLIHLKGSRSAFAMKTDKGILIKFFDSFRNWKDTPCVFTVSTGRTGTVTLIELISLSPRVQAFHEPKPLLGDLNVKAFYNLNQNPEQYRKAFIRNRWKKISAAGFREKIYVEHSVMVAFMPLIADLLPNSKFIHLYRHPGAVVRSGMRRGWFQGHEWDHYRVSPNEGHADRNLWDSEWGPFEKNCWFWNRINAEGIRLAESLGQDRVMQVAFERLVDSEDSVVGEIFDFIGVSRPGESQIKKVLAKKHNSQQSNEFPVYSDWDLHLKRQLKSIAGGVMKKLDYDLEV